MQILSASCLGLHFQIIRKSLQFEIKFVFLKHYGYICTSQFKFVIVTFMDIVSRLKLFLDYLGIPVTQFADNCGIPRPTLSQLLNGRNKTVRDEIIAKIHDAYPQLSIMWLMFGEGEMVEGKSETAENPVFTHETSDGSENQNLSDFNNSPIPEDSDMSLPLDFMLDNEPMHDNGSLLSENPSTADSRPDLTGPLETLHTRTADHIDAKGADRTITFHQEDMSRPQPQPSTTAPNGKHVVSIIVYYSDNSYQSFVPDSQASFPGM